MTTLLSSAPTAIFRPAYGVVFQFGEASPGARVGCVYLFYRGQPYGEPYYVVFEVRKTWDQRNGYWFDGYIPLSKRALSSEERLYFQAMAERELA